MNLRYIPSLILIGIFYFFFLLTSPLGVFNDWIQPLIQKGFFSITQIDPGDDSGYYAYIRSIFFDGDIDFFNEVTFAHASKFMSTGYVFNNWQLGQSVLFFPFFLFGHVLASLLNSLGYPISLDGYSFPYYMSTALASQTYLFIGLLFTYRINRNFFDTTASLIATISVWLATSLLYYTFVRQRMAHTTEFFLSAAFVWVWLNNRQSSDILRHAVLGMILGVLCMARVINVALGILYVVDQLNLAGLLGKPGSTSKKTLLIRLGYFSGFWFLTFTPQLLTWYKIDGIPLPALHAKIAQSETSAFSVDKLWRHTKEFFWGQKWGLIFSSPLILVGTIGLALWKPLSHLRLASTFTIMGYFAVVILLFGYLDAYEYRYLSPALPLISLGIAAILNSSLKSLYWRWPVLIALFTLIIIQYFIFVQYKISIQYNDPQFILKALSAIPEIITNRPFALLRSTNFITLFVGSMQVDWTYLEFCYLVFFPLTQLVLVVFFAFLFFRNKKTKTESGFKPFYIFGIALTCALNFTLLMAAPAKSKEEIQSRLKYESVKKLAEKASAEGRIEESVNYWKNTIQLIPNFWIPYFRLGVLLTENNYPDRALEILQKGYQLHPKHPGINFFLGLNFMILGDYDHSEDNFRQAIRLSRKNPVPYERLAYTLHKKGNYKEAESNYKLSILLNPQFAIAHLNLSILLTELKRHEEAVGHLKTAIAFGLRTPAVIALARSYRISL